MTVVWASNGTPIQTNLVPARLPNTPVGVILRWPFPVGTNNLGITVTAGTAVASCSTTVTVVDTTPPNIVCPPSQTVEFQDENGAVANFVVTATDTCSPVSLAATPPSGSVFPIGVTPVQVAAADAYTNLSQCSFTVTVLGAWGVKSNVLAESVILRAGATHRVDCWELNEAIEDLIDALGLDVPDAPTWVQQAHRHEHCARHHHLRGPLWLDQTHVDRRNGAWVFAGEQDAVRELVEIIRYRKSGIPQAVAQGLIDRLVKCDRLLAVVSLEDAVKAGASKNKLAKMLKQMAEGDEDAAANEPVQAIHDYWAAWAEAANLR